jgi:hypothetical protein
VGSAGRSKWSKRRTPWLALRLMSQNPALTRFIIIGGNKADDRSGNKVKGKTTKVNME